jgi:alanine dehydrogenase
MRALLTLFLTEENVNELLSFRDAYEALREGFILEDNKKAVNTKRVRTAFSGVTLTYQAGAYEGFIGFKTYVRGNFISLLFSSEGELLMLTEADRMSLLRTGALSVLAADLMKRNYSEVGIIGLGKQGIAQAEAFWAMKGVKLWGYTRTKERETKASEILRSMGVQIKMATSVKELASMADVVVTITTSTTPFLKLEYLKPDSHVNAMGSNLSERIELFPDVLRASQTISVEDIQQAKEEAGDLILANKMNMLDWDKVVKFSEVVTGKRNPRPRSGITVFKSVGIGLEDVVVMGKLYELAQKRGLGKEIKVSGRWYRG